jgi:hypothetical protein
MSIPWQGAFRRIADRFVPATPLLSYRFAHRLQNSRYTALPTTHHTLSSLIQLEARPEWVRLLYFNDEPTAWRLDAAAVAVTAAIGDGYTPVGSDGRPDPGLWRRVTFQSAASGEAADPLDQESSDRYSIDLPPNRRESGRPVMVLSDWVPLTGPERTDGAGSLLLVRSHSQGRVRYAGSVGLADPAIGRVHRGHWFAGDAASPPFEGIAQPDDTIFAAYGVQGISVTASATVIGIGDSIIHSSCTSGELSGFGIRACGMISTPLRPVSYVNEGYPGRNSTGFCWNGAWMIRHLEPQVALIQTWTQNEDWSQAASDAAFARAIALADVARRHGCVPILVTPAPVFAGQPEFDVYRRSNLMRVRAAGAAGMRVLDLDALWGTGGTPNAYRNDCGCGDATHPSDAGCDRAARVLAPMLTAILAGAR